MAVYPKVVWDQLRNTSVEKLERALRQDGWELIKSRGATKHFINSTRNAGRNKVVLHYHNNMTKGPNLLKNLLDKIGWSLDDLKRLKLIK